MTNCTYNDQNPHDVTTDIEAAFGDGPMNTDSVYGCTGPSQSIDSQIWSGGLARVGGGACISVDVNGNLCQEEEGEVDVEVEVKREGWIFCLIATRVWKCKEAMC